MRLGISSYCLLCAGGGRPAAAAAGPTDAGGRDNLAGLSGIIAGEAAPSEAAADTALCGGTPTGGREVPKGKGGTTGRLPIGWMRSRAGGLTGGGCGWWGREGGGKPAGCGAPGGRCCPPWGGGCPPWSGLAGGAVDRGRDCDSGATGLGAGGLAPTASHSHEVSRQCLQTSLHNVHLANLGGSLTLSGFTGSATSDVVVYNVFCAET